MPLGNVPSGYAKEISRNHTEKSVVRVGLSAASAGISAGQYAIGAPNIALLAAGAAASATGIGLVVTGAALTLATMGASARSAYKTYHHRSNLQEIFGRKNCYACKAWPAYSQDHKEHTQIADEVLPYIISQKGEKLAKKGVGALGGGALTAAYGVGRAIYKSVAGTKGVTRAEKATLLSHHFMTHNCGLAQAIVAELYSFEEMLWLLEKDTDTATPLLMKKMAST